MHYLLKANSGRHMDYMPMLNQITLVELDVSTIPDPKFFEVSYLPSEEGGRVALFKIF